MLALKFRESNIYFNVRRANPYKRNIEHWRNRSLIASPISLDQTQNRAQSNLFFFCSPEKLDKTACFQKVFFQKMQQWGSSFFLFDQMSLVIKSMLIVCLVTKCSGHQVFGDKKSWQHFHTHYQHPTTANVSLEGLPTPRL